MSDELSRDERRVLYLVADERVYRTANGSIMHRVASGTNLRCDKLVRSLMGRGLVAEPPEGASFYEPTDAAEPLLAQRHAQAGVVVTRQTPR